MLFWRNIDLEYPFNSGPTYEIQKWAKKKRKKKKAETKIIMIIILKISIIVMMIMMIICRNSTTLWATCTILSKKQCFMLLTVSRPQTIACVRAGVCVCVCVCVCECVF